MIAERARADLGWGQLLEQLAGRCRTLRGAEEAAELGFCARPEEAEERAAEIAEARRLDELAAPLPFGGITEQREALARADKGSPLEPEELVAIAHLARGCLRLRQHLGDRSEVAPRLGARAADIADLGHVFHPILEAFDPDGRLHDHASDALGGLRRQVARLSQALEGRARSLVDDDRFATALQDRYWTQRHDRYVLPVRAAARGDVPGIVHGTSQSGQTIFIEPDEMVDLNNQLELAECAVADEERRILAELTGFVAEETGALRRGAAIAAGLDVLAAAARLADDLGASPAIVSRDGELALVRARHPLMVLAGKPCVPNDIALAPGTVLVISGPNAGGKTVALKTAGLAALMVRAGLHVPADDESRVPWYGDVLTAIGDLQSIENELSTFSAHLAELRAFVAEAGPGTLVLVDELCGATEPEQGAALAQAVLEELLRRGAPAIVTTHYERLKALAAEDPRLANASVGFDLETMAPTFQLHLGVAGASGAIALAQRMGLPGAIVERADALLGEGRASVERLLAEVADERDRLQDERAELARLRAEAERARERAEEAEARAKERQRKAHEGAHGDAVSALRAVRRELDDVKQGLKRRRKVEAVRGAERRVDELARQVGARAPEKPLPGVAARQEDLVPGARVFVPSLGGRGTIAAAPERGQVTVQIGALKTTVAASAVRLDPSAPRPAPADTPRRSRGPALTTTVADDEGRTTLRTPDATIDVRGERAHEAVEAVDRFLDQSLLAERDVVFVIHGHGTGALRQAVRSHLRGHRSIAKWRPGEPSEGGDGVTVAWLAV